MPAPGNLARTFSHSLQTSSIDPIRRNRVHAPLGCRIPNHNNITTTRLATAHRAHLIAHFFFGNMFTVTKSCPKRSAHVGGSQAREDALARASTGRAKARLRGAALALLLLAGGEAALLAVLILLAFLALALL